MILYSRIWSAFRFSAIIL